MQFYRYYSRLDWAEQCIVESKLYFASRPQLNDPLEYSFLIRAGEDTHVPQASAAALLNCASVCLFSESNDHPLLWAHYADTHRGICLEFAARSENSLFNGARKVAYQPSLPVIDLEVDFVNAAQAGAKLFLTKADTWAYEREWRLLDLHSSPGLRSYNPADLTGVILGSKADPKVVIRVQRWINARATPIRLYQASVARDAYRVSIIPFARY